MNLTQTPTQSPLSLLVSVLTATLGAVTYWMFAIGEIVNDACFAALTVLLLAYVAVQIAVLRRLHPQRWILNPVVLASLVTFAIGYGFTNVLFLMPEDQQELLGHSPGITAAMVKLMALALVAVVAMWLGYWSPPASYLSLPTAVAQFQAKALPRSSVLWPLTIPILVIISSGARLMLLKIGAFGYSSTTERLVDLASWTQYLFMAASVGKLALAIAALRSEGTSFGLTARTMMYVVLSIEVGWGLLSGFKSAVVLPFVIVGVCRYMVTGQIPVRWILAGVAGLVMAYALVEPFRAQRNIEAGSAATSFSEVAQTLTRSRELAALETREQSPLLLTVTFRSNLTYSGSAGITYADDGALTLEDPTFLRNILLSPAYAYVPRLLWSTKPLGTLGLWYNQVVWGRDSVSADAMGPVTYLYFAGGATAVFLGFLLVGIVQRVTWSLLEPWSSLPGAVVFLALLSQLAIIDSSFDGVLIRLFREVPLLLVMQFLMFHVRDCRLPAMR